MSATTLPGIAVDDVQRIFNDGQHNAFTDLCEFQGKFYLAFRANPVSHDILPGSTIVILACEQGESWQEVHRFDVPGRDPRDPHFMIFNDKLHIYCGSWVVADFENQCSTHEQWNNLLGVCVTTADGEHWSEPLTMESTKGHYIWRCASYDGSAYLCGRRINQQATDALPPGSPEVVESAMLQSSDGIHWSTAGLFQEENGNETAFMFHEQGPEKGHVAAIARTRTAAQLCKAAPPYTTWERTSLGRFVGGPMIANWGGHLLVAGRKNLTPDAQDKQPRTVLSWLAQGELHDMLTLPSGGDNSYTGFVALSPTTALLSYYSSHEGSGSKRAPSAIYMAKLSLKR